MAFCMMRKGGGGVLALAFFSLYTFPFVVEVLDLDAIKFWSGYAFVFWLMRSTLRGEARFDRFSQLPRILFTLRCSETDLDLG